MHFIEKALDFLENLKVAFTFDHHPFVLKSDKIKGRLPFGEAFFFNSNSFLGFQINNQGAFSKTFGKTSVQPMHFGFISPTGLVFVFH